jgi:pilus assembly protein CpaF
MSDPFIVRRRVPEAVRRRDATVVRDGGERVGLPSPEGTVDAGAAASTRAAGPSSPPDHPALAPLRDVLSDPDITDVFVNGEDGLFVDRGAGVEHVPQWRAGADELRQLAVALIGIGGVTSTTARLVDVRWEHGTRVHAVLPPIACSGAAISIRLPSADVPDLDELGRRGMFDRVTGARLEALVAERANLLVTGATGAGKTTLLAALLGRVPAGERIVTIEDVAELRVAHPHHVRLEARQPNLEGAGAVTLARLVREALRMRPDRLVVGECRGDEVRELLMALNTGHAGEPERCTPAASGKCPLASKRWVRSRARRSRPRRQVVSAIGVIIHVERGRDGCAGSSASPGPC